jgi:uncharacterized protein (DUF302 family)
MAQQLTMRAQPGREPMRTPATVIKLTHYYDDTYDAVIGRFRVQVPRLDTLRMRAATNSQDVTRVVEDAKSPSGFVLFAEYNHAGWMRHFTPQGRTLQRAHRFTFGNPLYALPVLQQRIDVALHIPLDCCIVEERDECRTKLIATLPISFVEIDGGDSDDVRATLAEIEQKMLALVQSLAPPSDTSRED